MAWALADALALQPAAVAWADAAAVALAPAPTVALQPGAMPLPAAARHSVAASVQTAASATRQLLRQNCTLVAALALLALAVADALEEVGLEAGLDLALVMALAVAVPLAPPRLLGSLPAAAPSWAVGKAPLAPFARQVAISLWASAGQRPSPRDQPVALAEPC